MIIVLMGEGDAEAASEAETATVGFTGKCKKFFLTFL